MGHQLFEFITNQWALCLAFVVVLILLIIHELRNKASGTTQVSPAAAVHQINREDAVIIDIRELEQFRQGHIVGAKNIPAEKISQKNNVLEKYQQKPLIITCNDGLKSPKFATTLKKEGYTATYIKGGMNAWRQANLPVAKGK